MSRKIEFIGGKVFIDGKEIKPPPRRSKYDNWDLRILYGGEIDWNVFRGRVKRPSVPFPMSVFSKVI